MITAWTDGLNDEDKERLIKQLKSSTGVLDRLKELMDKDEEALTRREISSKVYETPNWDYKQADANGYRRCLTEYKKLLTLTKE